MMDHYSVGYRRCLLLIPALIAIGLSLALVGCGGTANRTDSVKTVGVLQLIDKLDPIF